MIPKFRAWIAPKNKMVDVLKIDLVNKEITYRIDNEFFNDEQGNPQNGAVAKLKDVVLMQSIGLCDADHKKIYDGDIVESFDMEDNRILNVIMYSKNCQAYVLESIENYGNPFGIFGTETIAECVGALIMDADFNLYTEVFKIVGNVFENPELLNIN